MTRAEAAQICQSIKFILANSDYTEAVEEALDMAIAALKQLSLPKIIIRQGEQEPSAQPFTEEQIQTMQELESAQVEKAYELGKADRPKGEWIKTEHCLTENGYRKWIELECPFCGFRPVFELIDDMEFCPKCGANMTGGEKE